MNPNIINKVKTPLGFTVFSVLILESFLGVIAINATENQLTYVLLMLGFVLIAYVSNNFIAWFKPEALNGERYDGEKDRQIAMLEKQIEELKVNVPKTDACMHCESMKIELESALKKVDAFSSATNTIAGMFARNRTTTMDNIKKEHGQTYSNQELWSAINQLSEQNRIKERLSGWEKA
ncbi:hypothetical protein ACN930_004729 [Vibrio parahaemolyticus]|uniref:hypothetical protein n=1 Tax=Vibrio parahaemolyticus TaxID=670 RepID=UPI001B83A739|nr:hypothetical protein [Vibrio parahaemolyticus]EGQ9221700.1 hypothetical protein [Vibrio parahaemolyticus]MBE4733163.1 hypothetical protein [Vibrio parahaemolyticus]MBE4767185.1 hypothetical protein [Vibrio parahaemolyticus]HBC3910817.1 hypothetical protein [Vibrio parahaemolyticus]HCM0840970.1 hypothetical protein [Vibrio parahaemolyticus]